MPVDCAAHEGYLDCVRILLKHDADIDWGDALNENTIHKAAAKGHFEILRLLLESRRPPYAVINRQNVLGSAPLHLARHHYPIKLVAFRTSPNVTSCLLCFCLCLSLLLLFSNLGGFPNLIYVFPVKALDRGHVQCAELLIRFGADPKLEDFFGYVPTLQPITNRQPSHQFY